MLRPPVGPVHFLLEFLANLQECSDAPDNSLAVKDAFLRISY